MVRPNVSRLVRSKFGIFCALGKSINVRNIASYLLARSKVRSGRFAHFQGEPWSREYPRLAIVSRLMVGSISIS